MNDKLKHTIDIDKLEINWARQRVQINERITERTRVRSRRIWGYALATAVAIVMFAAIISWPLFKLSEDVKIDEKDYLDTELFEDVGDMMPQSLYVLNNIDDGEYDLESMVNYMVPSNGNEEDQ